MTVPLAAGRPSIETPSEQERALIDRVRAGDYEAFLVLFRAYHAPLERFGERLTGSSDTAEDIVQDVFVAIWERRETWDVRSGVHRYLYGAVRNRAFDCARRRALEARSDRTLASEDGQERAADPAELAEVRAAVARAIERLPARCRAVYRLRHYHELTYAEIAHVLGLSVKTVEMHVSSALKALRGRLQHLR